MGPRRVEVVSPGSEKPSETADACRTYENLLAARLRSPSFEENAEACFVSVIALRRCRAGEGS